MKGKHSPDDILRFWFPERPEPDHVAMARRLEWWFAGGANSVIIERFAALHQSAASGELIEWERDARSRLALIIVLDQFSRTLHGGTPLAYAQDANARRLSREGISNGHYATLTDPWEKTFFVLPLGHSEELDDLNLVVDLTDAVVRQAPPEYRRLLEFSANQARGHRDTVARFGRQPHRNQALGRVSTIAELEYLATAQLVHQRRPPAT